MNVIMFQPRFARLVEGGVKLQTIRPVRKRCPLGDVSLREWTGKPYRSKQRELCKGYVQTVVPIEITPPTGVWINGESLSIEETIEFAKRDGFDSPQEMFDWFSATHGLPFVGIVITWE